MFGKIAVKLLQISVTASKIRVDGCVFPMKKAFSVAQAAYRGKHKLKQHQENLYSFNFKTRLQHKVKQAIIQISSKTNNRNTHAFFIAYPS